MQNLAIEDIKETEIIKSFYSGIDNWEIVARVIKKDYREFHNKKGKFTKVINIVLIDRSKMKIDGACFGDAATLYNEKLKEGQVYKIAKGNVSEDDYVRVRQRGSDYSKYKILFNEKSKFTPIADVGIVPYGEDKVFTLSEFYEMRTFEQDFDVVAILLEVKDEIDLPGRDGKQIRKRSLIVADPEKEISMEVIIWNDKPEVKPEIVGKTILLSSFRLKEYKDVLSLNSNFRSKVNVV